MNHHAGTPKQRQKHTTLNLDTHQLSMLYIGFGIGLEYLFYSWIRVVMNTSNAIHPIITSGGNTNSTVELIQKIRLLQQSTSAILVV